MSLYDLVILVQIKRLIYYIRSPDYSSGNGIGVGYTVQELCPIFFNWENSDISCKIA